MSENVKKFIYSHWKDCIKENREDHGTLIGLPYPYTVPSVGYFDEMYYWDTYFTNKGLELSGMHMQAKHNTDNMLYLVERYGFMPNGNRTFYLNRSQPPFLSIMVRDVYEHYRDTAWLRGAYETLKKEYGFWKNKRNTPVGLNYYGPELTKEGMEAAYEEFIPRLENIASFEKEKITRHCIACAESGWDLNPRWDFEGYSYTPVDLNALLFMFEENMAYFSEELQDGEAVAWRTRAEARKADMLHYMENEEHLLLDYQFEEGKLSRVFSAASYYVLFAGLGEERHAKALAENLNRLEEAHGISVCERPGSEISYQWDYPNGWACMQYIVVKGLAKYGYMEDAVRIAKKYVTLVDKVFEETGNLWEKYNVVTGTNEVKDEYAMPAMMGWSAGVYLAFEAFLSNEK